MQLIIDVRKAFDSGIGTYIRHVVPRTLQLLGGVRAAVLVGPEGIDRHDYLRGCDVDPVEMHAKPLGLQEQKTWRSLAASNAIVWATSLAHPLFAGHRRLAVTVHDVAQLALPPAAAGGRFVQLATRVYFRSIRSAALRLFNSEFTRAEFADRVGTASGRDVVTPLGVDPWWFDAGEARRAAGTSSPAYFICVGNVRPHKNLRALLAAMSLVRDQLPHQLVLIGQHEGFRTADENLVRELDSLGDRVQFLGHVEQSALGQWVAEADAMVLPSLYEGFGLPALEAMAAGCPVLASTAGAFVEVCGSAARFFDPQRPEELAKLLLSHAAQASGERERLVRLGRARAMEFTWDRTARLSAESLAALLESRLT